MNGSQPRDSRFAVYLIPPYHVARRVAEIHSILRKQFGLIAADQFQAHITIKGFFEKAPGPLEPLIERLDAVFAAQRPFPVHPRGLRIDPGGIGMDLSLWRDKLNEELLAVRERVVDAVRPFIASDCDFSSGDLSTPFRAHLTLAFRDIPLELYDEVLDYLRWAPLPSQPFTADRFHLLQFWSDDWPGEWERTLRWELIKSWTLVQRRPLTWEAR